MWVASPRAATMIRVDPGGAVIEEFPIEGRQPYACMLGGHDRRDLFICLAAGHDPGGTRKARRGAIAAVRVSVAGSGRP